MGGQRPDPWRDPVEELVDLGVTRLRVLRPRDAMDLLDEEAFERDEYLPYWAELWPSGLALARAVAAAAPGLRDRRVLELGCGIGVPAIVAAGAGAQVLASDWSSDAIAFTTENARRAGVALTTVVCSWSHPQPLLAQAPFDLVLAADVLYERRNVDQLLALLPRLVDHTGEVWLADPGRRRAAEFLTEAAPTWRWDERRDATHPEVIIRRLRKRAGLEETIP